MGFKSEKYEIRQQKEFYVTKKIIIYNQDIQQGAGASHL
jgi:hypothetical protein